MPGMDRMPGRLVPFAWRVAPGLLAATLALELSRPFKAGPVAFDSAVAVLHFQRIVEGRHLEAFVATTPKPLLTFLYGPLFEITHDWRVLTWVTIIAFAVAVSLATALARRLGGWRAGIFAGVALAGAPALLFDASLALATPWAMLLWAIAGLAVSAQRPRYVVAGTAMALASLARLETVVVIGAALAVMAAASVAPGRFRCKIPRSGWWIGLGLLAIPVSMAHDWRLTGDPFFWLTVSARYSEATRNHVLTVPQLAAVLAHRYIGEAALVVLGVIGWLRLAGQRQWAIALGLFGLGPGIAALLLFLAARHTYVSDRYFAGIDVAIAFAAALGIGAVSVELPAAIRNWAAHRRLVRSASPPVLVAVLAVALSAGWAGAGTNLRPTIRAFTKAAVSERLAVPALRKGVVAALAAGQAKPGRALITVPVQLRPHVVVDLGLALDQVASTDPGSVNVAAGNPAPGELLLHSLAAGSSIGLKQLEVSEPTQIGSATVVPLLADPATGTWVVRIDNGR